MYIFLYTCTFADDLHMYILSPKLALSAFSIQAYIYIYIYILSHAPKMVFMDRIK